ncbi:MAG: hypothetical protein IJA86_03600 [Clostridia bacterium]|nr:hypothetical protein [Clostridia bacterium]
MAHPILNKRSAVTKTIRRFEGYRKEDGTAQNTFSDMKNLSGQKYPYLSTRVRRGIWEKAENCKGIEAGEELCVLNGNLLYIGNKSYPLTLFAGEKELVVFGQYLLIFPDGKYINLKNPGEAESISVSIMRDHFELSLWRENGIPFVNVFIGEKAPTETLLGGERWLDTSMTPYAFKVFDGVQMRWKITERVEKTYVRIFSEDIGTYFEAGDAIRIDGMVSETHLNGIQIIGSVDRHSLWIEGLVEKTSVQETEASFERMLPALKNLFVAKERLWGTEEITDENGRVSHRIYGSKKNNFKNFYYFSDTDEDSCYFESDAGGDWTGACAYAESALFFKENLVYSLSGKGPSSFRLDVLAFPGVAKGNEGSLAQTDGGLYYRSADGIYRYDGKSPKKISEALGSLAAYPVSHGGAQDSKYYISLHGENGDAQMFVYDRVHDFWHREDEMKAKYFCKYGETLYFLNEKKGEIMTVTSEGVWQKESARDLHWHAQTVWFGMEEHAPKYPVYLEIRTDFPKPGSFRTEIEYSSNGVSETIAEYPVCGMQTLHIPIPVRVRAPYRFRFSGTGEMTLFSFAVREI